MYTRELNVNRCFFFNMYKIFFLKIWKTGQNIKGLEIWISDGVPMSRLKDLGNTLIIF